MLATVLSVLGVAAVLFGAAVLATRSGEELAVVHPDRADLVLPDGPLAAQDVRGLRFGMALRGYRMSEVDAVLDRCAAELAERDSRIAALEGRAGDAVDLRGAPAGTEDW